MVLAPDIVAFFNTDIRRFKAKLRAVEKLKSGPKKYRKKEPVDPKMKAYIEKLLAQPVVLVVEPDVEEIFDSCVDQDELEQMCIAVKVCYDYMAGYETLEQCCKNNGVDRKTFFRWRKNSPQMTHLFKRAQVERNKALKERDTEDSIDTIRKLMKGYTVTEENKTYKIVTGYKGNEVLIPTAVTVREKHIQPSLGASIYMSTNRDPENWKRNRSLDELFKEKARPEDIFEKMSDEELRKYIEDGDKLFGGGSD